MSVKLPFTQRPAVSGICMCVYACEIMKRDSAPGLAVAVRTGNSTIVRPRNVQSDGIQHTQGLSVGEDFPILLCQESLKTLEDMDTSQHSQGTQDGVQVSATWLTGWLLHQHIGYSRIWPGRRNIVRPSKELVITTWKTYHYHLEKVVDLKIIIKATV